MELLRNMLKHVDTYGEICKNKFKLNIVNFIENFKLETHISLI